jgi:hypothetical protein
VPDEEQTLTDTSITLNATHTTMKFTKPLVEDGELTINAYEKNTFIYATGVVNALSPYSREGAFTMKLTPCGFASGDNIPVNGESVSDPNGDVTFWTQTARLANSGFGMAS